MCTLGVTCYNFQKVLLLFLDFVLAYSADPDEMPQNAAFHQCLHCLQKYLLRGFESTNC